MTRHEFVMRAAINLLPQFTDSPGAGGTPSERAWAAACNLANNAPSWIKDAWTSENTPEPNSN